MVLCAVLHCTMCVLVPIGTVHSNNELSELKIEIEIEIEIEM